jgi:NTE family protein
MTSRTHFCNPVHHDPTWASHSRHVSLPPYRTVALVLQGGGALGAYQAGVYEGLEESGVAPNWIAGISIGALNTAIIAGNAPGKRLARLREFWETICRPAYWTPLAAPLEDMFFNDRGEVRKSSSLHANCNGSRRWDRSKRRWKRRGCGCARS